MEFSHLSLRTINEVIADVLENVGDRDMKLLTPGFYKRRVKSALDELNFNTYFDVRFTDYPMPASCQLMIPEGAWNLNDLYAYSGACDTVNQMQTIHKKFQFVGRGRTGTQAVGYTSRNNAHNADPLYSHNFSFEQRVLFYNVDNGRILLSDSCLAYDMIRIVYNGVASNIDQTKIIPEFCVEGLIAVVTERALFAMKSKDKTKRLDWADSVPFAKEGKMNNEYRLKHLSTKERSDLYDYMSRLNA